MGDGHPAIAGRAAEEGVWVWVSSLPTSGRQLPHEVPARVAAHTEFREHEPAAVAPIEGKLVCSCNGIGEDTITRTVREQTAAGSCSLNSVCAATRAGTSCGSCRPEVGKLLAQTQTPSSAALPAMAG